jgi:guanosine-3',5'-bis(diphosphate) 3'-pyrophosphohydrolase
VAARLAPEVSTLGAGDQTEALTIAGSEGSAVKFAACCLPVPGDSIMGWLSAGKGVIVHRANCRNVREFRKQPDHCIDVIWAPIRRGMFEVALLILAKNVPGVLANISTSIGEAGSNIEKIEQPEANQEIATLLFTISVRDRDHMAHVMRRLRRNRNVTRVSRINA